MDISFDKNVHATNSVKLDLDILVVAPVAHSSHVSAAGIVLLVACEQPC